MLFTQKVARFSRLGMSFIVLMSVQHSAMALPPKGSSSDVSSGLLPIERSYVDPDLVNALFPIDEDKDDKQSSNNNNNNNNSNNQNRNGNNNGNGNNNNNQNRNGNNNNNNNNNNQNRVNSAQNMKRASVDEQFRCNIFENTSYEDVLSAINSLNQAVNSPSCGGANSKLDMKAIADNNAKITSAITSLRGYIDNPETVQSDKSADIVNSVDAAIRAASSLATTFAQTDILSKDCRNQMNAGQIATSIGDIMNGLTPYALMAAQLTGGTAAIPFIVGGSIVTGAISSMGKIIDENTVKINDPQVRRAIVENTCQFIRLDQRYKFLIKSRTEQLKKISDDISQSQRLFSAQLKDVSDDAQNIMNRKNFLSQAALKLNSSLATAQSQLEVDKQFLKMTSDDIQICSLGIQVSTLARDKTSYVSTLLTSLDDSMTAYGSNNVAQAQALKNSANFAIQTLASVGQTRFNIDTNFANCAKITRSLVETVDRAGTTSKQLIKLAQADLDRQIKGSRDLGLFKQSFGNMKNKEVQAERVAGSLENLRAQATKITQSEIDAEMDRLRKGLLAPRTFGIQSPVQRWFSYVVGLHKADVTKFQTGLESLRQRAFNMSDSRKQLATAQATGPMTLRISSAVLVKEREAANQLATINLKNMPLGTRDHDDACREMQDVWGRWVTAVDHLAAIESFCSMLEPYIYDNRKEDEELVTMCRGYSQASGGLYGVRPSTLNTLKQQLIGNNIRDWAVFLDKKIQSMVCSETTEATTLK